jgi:hypothetical protein
MERKSRNITEDSVTRLSAKRIERFRKAFEHRFFLRFHMTLILTGVFFSGLIVSKLLLEIGMRSMLIRYTLVAVLSYLMFFLFIKLWLLHFRRSSQSLSPDTGVGDLSNLFGIGTAPSSGSAQFTGHGGGFGGGGASGDWVDSPSEAATVSASATVESGGSPCASAVGDIDLGDGWIVLVVLGVLLALIFGVGMYLVYVAPTILSDAATQVLLASSLIKASKKMDSPDWVGSIFRATWIPFVIVMILSAAVAWVSAHYCPGASKLTDVLKCLR